MPRKDLDSILDAALDELDDNLETNGNFESDVHGKSPDSASVSDGNTFSCNNNGTSTTKTTSLGVPYSLDYLSRCEQESSTSGRRTSDGNITKAHMFGPEPPPPPTDFFDTAAAALMSDKSVQKEMEKFQKELENFDFNGSEEFNQLFQRMNQAFPGVNLDLGDDAEFDTAMKNMMRMANTGRVENSGKSGRNSTKMTSSTRTTSRSKHQSTNKSPASDMPSPDKYTDRSKQCSPPQGGASTNQTIPSKNIGTEPNVDESIHRLLEGINKASSSTPTNNNNTNLQRLPFPPSLPPGMENIDPSQFEEFSEEIMSTLMKEFEQMGKKDDSNIVVDNVMKQLLDRDIMYEPMKEVCTRFPKYLAEHKDTLSSEEYTRYGTQYQYFQRIVHVYETEPNNFDRLMELMQDIQEYGQPPVEIIKELAPELEFDAEGMPIMNSGGGGGGGMPPFLPGMMGNEQCCIS